MSFDNLVEISIVVPVYNTPLDYFMNCINTITNTTYQNYEIIVIDDGSESENSRKYKEYLEKIEKVKYYQKSNGGVSSARNCGIQMAQGEYIAFVDADDVVTSEFLSDASSLIEKYSSDVIIGTMKFSNREWFPQGANDELYLSKKNISSLKKCFLGIEQPHIPNAIIGSPCGRLYKRSIVLNNMFLEKLAYSEDQLFNRIIFNKIETAVLVPNIWYIYNQNDFSAMHNALAGNHMKKLIPFFDEWENMNEKEDDEQVRIGSRIRSIAMFYGAVNDIVAHSKLTFTEKIEKIDNLYMHKIFSNLATKLPLKYKMPCREKAKFFMIKYRMKYLIYILASCRHKIHYRK